jgi:hypothetical protein
MTAVNGEWESRTNRELEELSKGENIVKWIKGAKDKLAGSPGENAGGQGAQKDLHSRTGRDKMKRKTHRKGWRELERDLQVLGVRRWRELLIDREKWRGIVGQAKAHSGLYANGGGGGGEGGGGGGEGGGGGGGEEGEEE